MTDFKQRLAEAIEKEVPAGGGVDMKHKIKQETYEEIEKSRDLLARTLGRLLGRGHIFICGASVAHTGDFPDRIYVCAALGSDSMAVYKLVEGDKK